MKGFEKRIDIAISYSELASVDASRVSGILGDRFSVYNYKNWLDQQAGQRIEEFSERIYTEIPCIILATRDWFVRPSTVLEMKFLARNRCRKLVFDYAGFFFVRRAEHGIQHVQYGEFEKDAFISPHSILAFSDIVYRSDKAADRG